MAKTLKNSFTQAALGSTIWITLLTSVYNSNQAIPFKFIWNIIFIGLLLGLTFGVIYPYLWNYSTFKASLNIFISTIVNSICMFLTVRLYSINLFHLVQPYWIGIVLLTLVGHIIGFYFYSKYQNKQLKKELNQLI
ncbi:hypothetical protein [Vagococcus sp.]|uniref:hypothetical protein n=1 Tax=Vagococcus sp. TaxID=1933889 RepID=UPI003F9D1A01